MKPALTVACISLKSVWHAVVLRSALTALLLAPLAPAGELKTGGTEIVMMPPPWTGNGQCLREMLRRENEWSRVRGSIQSFGYWPWLLNAHFSDDEIRELFAKLKSWDLKLGFEVPGNRGQGATA